MVRSTLLEFACHLVGVMVTAGFLSEFDSKTGRVLTSTETELSPKSSQPLPLIAIETGLRRAFQVQQPFVIVEELERAARSGRAAKSSRAHALLQKKPSAHRSSCNSTLIGLVVTGREHRRVFDFISRRGICGAGRPHLDPGRNGQSN